jgi:hypothetical protein
MFLGTLEFWSNEGSKGGLVLGTLGGGWELDFGLQTQGSVPSSPSPPFPRLAAHSKKKPKKTPNWNAMDEWLCDLPIFHPSSPRNGGKRNEKF